MNLENSFCRDNPHERWRQLFSSTVRPSLIAVWHLCNVIRASRETCSSGLRAMSVRDPDHAAPFSLLSKFVVAKRQNVQAKNLFARIVPDWGSDAIMPMKVGILEATQAESPRHQLVLPCQRLYQHLPPMRWDWYMFELSYTQNHLFIMIQEDRVKLLEAQLSDVVAGRVPVLQETRQTRSRDPSPQPPVPQITYNSENADR